MILSTLSISSHGFAFGFSKKPYTNADVFLTYKPMIIPSISQRGTPSQQSSPRIKYTIEPLLRPIEPSNSLPLIEARLLSLEPSNKVHHLFDTSVTFDYTFEGPNFFVRHLRILLTWLN